MSRKLGDLSSATGVFLNRQRGYDDVDCENNYADILRKATQ